MQTDNFAQKIRKMLEMFFFPIRLEMFKMHLLSPLQDQHGTLEERNHNVHNTYK